MLAVAAVTQGWVTMGRDDGVTTRQYQYGVGLTIKTEGEFAVHPDAPKFFINGPPQAAIAGSSQPWISMDAVPSGRTSSMAAAISSPRCTAHHDAVGR